MGKVEITITDEKSKIEKRRQDEKTYFDMIDCLIKSLNVIGIATEKSDKYLSESGIVNLLSTAKEEVAKIIPCRLEEKADLGNILIEVYDSRVFECVKMITEDFAEKYINLRSIDINTYF